MILTTQEAEKEVHLGRTNLVNETTRAGRSHHRISKDDAITTVIAKGASITFAGLLSRRVTNFVFQILLTHILGVAAYGIYMLGYSIVSIASMVSIFGLQKAAMRFGAAYHAVHDVRRLKGCFLLTHLASVAISSFSAVLLFLLSNTLAIRLFHKPELAGVLRLFSFAIPFFALLTVSAASLRGLKNMVQSTLVSEVLPSIGNLIIVGLAFLTGLRLGGAVFGFVAASAVTAGLGIYFLRQNSFSLVHHIKPVFEPKKIFGYSFTVLLADFSYLLLSQTDRIMLGYAASAKDVGIYSAAALLALQLPIFLCSFDGIFSPVIADLHSTGRTKDLNNLMKATTQWTISLTLPFFMVLVLFPPVLQVFGPQFAAGRSTLLILAFAQLLNVGTGSVQAILIMCNRQKLELYNGIALATLNIILNVLLIPKYGIQGAAVATGLSIMLVNMTRLVEVYGCFRIHPYKVSLFKPVMAALVALGAWLLIHRVVPLTGFTWIFGIILYFVFYFSTVCFLKFEEEDKVVIEAVKKRFLKR